MYVAQLAEIKDNLYERNWLIKLQPSYRVRKGNKDESFTQSLQKLRLG